MYNYSMLSANCRLWLANNHDVRIDMYLTFDAITDDVTKMIAARRLL